MKKLYKFALTCAIIVATSISVSAQVTIGTCGENLTWELDHDSRTLTIRGEGAMSFDSDDGNPPWISLSNIPKTLVLEEGITHIADFAFGDCDFLEGKITIPNSVTHIGAAALGGYISELYIGNSVTTIGNSAIPYFSVFGGSSPNLSSITCLSETPPVFLSTEEYLLRFKTGIPVYIPCGSKAVYKTTAIWSNFTNFTGLDCNLTVLSDNENLGSVSNNSGKYDDGSDIEITATPAKYCVFSKWSDGNSENPRLVTLASDITLTAIFLYDEFTSNLMEKITQLQRDSTTLQDLLTTANETITSSQNLLTTANNTITTLQSDSTNLQKLLKTANDTIVKLRADSTNLQKQLGTANASILTLQSDTASLKSQIKTLNEEKTTLTSQKEILQSEKQTATTNFNECNDKVSGLENKNTLLTTQVNDLQTQLTNCKSTDIPTIKSTDALRIYPNPAQDFITIEGVIQAEIAVIYDIAGRAMQTVALHVGSNTVNIAMLPNGTYRIVINGNSGTFMKE